ncbi:hypothetical protein DYB28_008700, partial [Aphanomyces astaci]
MAGKILSYYAGVPRTLSSGWFAGFVRRHHDLTTHVAQKLSHARNSVTKEGVMKCFFDLVKGCIGFACTASDVYNVDETRFKTKGSTKKSLAPNAPYPSSLHVHFRTSHGMDMKFDVRLKRNLFAADSFVWAHDGPELALLKSHKPHHIAYEGTLPL